MWLCTSQGHTVERYFFKNTSPNQEFEINNMSLEVTECGMIGTAITTAACRLILQILTMESIARSVVVVGPVMTTLLFVATYLQRL